MELCWHDIAEIVEGKCAFVRNHSLYFSLLIAAPKRPSYEIFVRAVRVIPKPKQAAVYQEPISPLPVEMLLPVCIADRKGLPGGEISTLH